MAYAKLTSRLVKDRQLLQYIIKHVPDMPAAIYHSNMKEADRSALRTSFENNGEDVEVKEYHVLCTVPNALGAGVTLTQASIVVFMEPRGKPTDVEQAWKRCHRVGQKKQVYVFNIDCADRVKGVPAENVVLNRGNLSSRIYRRA